MAGYSPPAHSTGLEAVTRETQKKPGFGLDRVWRLLATACGSFVVLAGQGVATRAVAIELLHVCTSANPAEPSVFADPAVQRAINLHFAYDNGAAQQVIINAKVTDRSPMLYFALVLTFGPDINTPPELAAQKQAIELLRNIGYATACPTQTEWAYIDALALRYSPEEAAPHSELDAAYSRAISDLAEQWPGDETTQLLSIESQLNDDFLFQHRLGDPQIVQKLKQVLASDPNSLAAHHFLIHSVDRSDNPADGLASADFLMRADLPPEMAHLRHMSSHIYYRIGDYARAAAANQAAITMDEAYFAMDAPPMSDQVHMYHTHNELFLLYSQMQLGDVEGALHTAGVLGGWWTYLVLVRFGEWDRVLAAPNGGIIRELDGTDKRWGVHFARAMAFAAKCDFEKANGEMVATQQSFDRSRNRARDNNLIEKIDLMLVQARLARCGDDGATETTMLKDATALSGQLTWSETPNMFFEVRELHGRALVREGRWEEARKVYEDELAAMPHSPASLAALVRIDTHLGDAAAAAAMQADFEQHVPAEFRAAVLRASDPAA